MADESKDTPRPFDVRTVEYLLRLMTDHDLSEVYLQEGDQRIRLRKGAAMPAAFLPPQAPFPHPAPVPATAPVPAATPPLASSAVAPSATVSSKKYHEIRSEVVGTFFTRPHPDKPEFVKVGSKVTPDTTVCIVMAMKVNNEIKAECAGTIVEVVAKNEDFVEHNALLFLVDTGG